MSTKSSTLHVALSVTALTDADRQNILAAIVSLAPSSSLYTQSSSIQAGYAALVKQGAVLKQGSDAIAADHQKLEADVGVHAEARAVFDRQLRALATLTEVAASTTSDLTSMGFHARGSVVTATAPLAAPSSITVKLPKRYGAATRVAAVYTGSGKPHFVAESSPDPVTATSWSALPGAGHTRALSGASGTRIWVRFATVRGGEQSPFCAPVLVTLP